MSSELREGFDYTVENGCWIFTASWLLARGYCCQNGCRHCPYGFKKQGMDPGNGPSEKEGEAGKSG